MERGFVRGDCLRLPGDIHGEGAEDGVRDKLCQSVCIGPDGGEYSANLHEPEGAQEICLMKVLFS